MTSAPPPRPAGAAAAAGPVPFRDAFVQLRRRDDPARPATIPAIPVEQALLDAIVAGCRPGETVAQFVESAVRASLRRRTAQAEFVARRAAAIDLARRASTQDDPEH